MALMQHSSVGCGRAVQLSKTVHFNASLSVTLNVVNTFFYPISSSHGHLCIPYALAGFLWTFNSALLLHMHKCECIFSRDRVAQVEGLLIVFCYIWPLIKCFPSSIGMHSASQPLRGDALSQSSKVSKDCPVAFADFGSVSVASSRFYSFFFFCQPHELPNCSDYRAISLRCLSVAALPLLQSSGTITAPPCLVAFRLVFIVKYMFAWL